MRCGARSWCADAYPASCNRDGHSCIDPSHRSERERPRGHAQRAQAQHRTVWSLLETAVHASMQQGMKRNNGAVTRVTGHLSGFTPSQQILLLQVACCCARVLTMAKADEPSASELGEIARGLCALANVTLDGPANAEQLRQLVDDPALPRCIRFALTACADALAEHESPAEIRELREAAEAYNRWRTRGAPLRDRLVRAINHARPLLDQEAEERAQGQEEALAALTDEQRAGGYVVRLWPSPESLHTFTREVLEVLRREDHAVPWLLKVVEDLTRLDADHRIITMLGPIKTRIAKMLGCWPRVGIRSPRSRPSWNPRRSPAPNENRRAIRSSVGSSRRQKSGSSRPCESIIRRRKQRP